MKFVTKFDKSGPAYFECTGGFCTVMKILYST
jgi:hypothetical protein